MTPERLAEIRSRSFATTPLESNIGFSGLSSEEADELLLEISAHAAAMNGKDAEVESLLNDVRELMTTARVLRHETECERDTVARQKKEYERLVDKYRRLVNWLNTHKVGGWETAVED